MVNNGNFATMN